MSVGHGPSSMQDGPQINAGEENLKYAVVGLGTQAGQMQARCLHQCDFNSVALNQGSLAATDGPLA